MLGTYPQTMLPSHDQQLGTINDLAELHPFHLCVRTSQWLIQLEPSFFNMTSQFQQSFQHLHTTCPANFHVNLQFFLGLITFQLNSMKQGTVHLRIFEDFHRASRFINDLASLQKPCFNRQLKCVS
eukprot:GCRY01004511.1.p2 GENE.GCRY01004511.1~~GCRY01004511.1.p2  ORF type:complete len:126 (-),score=5.91 GCRY01004511.1:158-535(-)